MPAVNFSLPTNNPNAKAGRYYYTHNNATSLSLLTFGDALTAFTTLNNTIISYLPGNPLQLFTTFEPGSAYIINNSALITIQNDNSLVFPATYTLTPGLNFVTVDQNALSAAFTDIFGVENLNKIRVIYGTYDGTDDGAVKNPSLYFNQNGVFNPVNQLGNLITSFKPGSSYLVVMKAGQTITFQYARKNQYIITDSGNTHPTGPGYIICCENGDRLTTGTEG